MAGIDLDTLSLKEGTERIFARANIATAMLPALDDWIAVRSKVKDEAATRRLVDVLRAADPDPWRQRVRDCLVRKDWAAMEILVSSPELDRQPAATISFLCAALRQQAEVDTDGGGGELGPRGFFLEIDILRRAQLSYPADYWISYRLGLTLIGLKSPPVVVQEGIGYLRTAIALRPQDGWAIVHMGMGHEYLQEYDRALACYRKALDVATQDGSVANFLAWHFLTGVDAKLRDHDLAVKMAQRAVELSPMSGTYWGTLAVAQYRAGDCASSGHSRSSRNYSPATPRAVRAFYLAMAHWQLGKQDQARQWYSRAVEWMEKENRPDEEDLRRFRTEAEELLKITDEKPTTKLPSK